MVMLNGDECGSIGNRRANVFFTCNPTLNKTEIVEVNEPETCTYKIVLASPLVCESSTSDTELYTNSMHVYPCLEPTLKSQWDRVYSELIDGLITEKVPAIYFKEITNNLIY